MNNPTSDQQDWDVVDEASFESFPASDPPGWGSAHAVAIDERASAGRDLLTRDDDQPRVLVLVNMHRRTQLAAVPIRGALEARGFHTELGDVASHPPLPLDYDAIVIGLSAGRRKDPALEAYLASFRSALAELPTAVFLVGSPRHCARASSLLFSLLGRAPDAIATFPCRFWETPPLELREVAALVAHLAALLPARADRPPA